MKKAKLDHEDIIYKLSKTKKAFIHYWMVLVDKELYLFYDNSKADLKKVTSISGCFIKDNGSEIIDHHKYYSFSVTSLEKQVTYYAKEKEVIKLWIYKIRKALDYRNVYDYYEIFATIQEEPNFIFKTGKSKRTLEKVLIKLIDKFKLTEDELIKIKTKIDFFRMCSHPCLIKFIDYFENSEFIFIVTEYYELKLSDYLENSELTDYFLILLLIQMLSAINYLHKFGITIKTIKPENITIKMNTNYKDSQFDIKLLNFCDSTIDDNEVKLGNFKNIESIFYLAPEQLKKEESGLEADIWSLGVVLFKAYSGNFPYEIDSKFDINAENLLYVINGSILRFPKKDWDLLKRKEIKEFLEMCLTKDPTSRPMIDELLELPFIKEIKVEMKKIKNN